MRVGRNRCARRNLIATLDPPHRLDRAEISSHPRLQRAMCWQVKQAAAEEDTDWKPERHPAEDQPLPVDEKMDQQVQRAEEETVNKDEDVSEATSAGGKGDADEQSK